ncbi:ABC transporter ATP-binding protein [Nocardia sp. NPDC055029]
MRLLSAKDLRAGYGAIDVVRGIELHVEAGEVVVILGANGAGKTTTLAALAGVIPARGEIEILGHHDNAPLHVRSRRGLRYLPDDRGIVRSLTVRENLRLARVDPGDAFDISPELEALLGRTAGQLSGGEQQILALTQAIASRPKVLIADEVSFGLAPIIVSRMLGLARLAADRGTGVLLVEQYAGQALATADRAYVLQRGEIVLQGEASALSNDLESLERSYLGTTA